jgi:hypothetical protein
MLPYLERPLHIPSDGLQQNSYEMHASSKQLESRDVLSPVSSPLAHRLAPFLAASSAQSTGQGRQDTDAKVFESFV